MTPEQLVPTLETCKLLREAGYKQGYSSFLLIDFEAPYNEVKACNRQFAIELASGKHPSAEYKTIVAAPTLQELLEELPQDTTPVNVLNVVKSYSGDFSVGYWDCTTQQTEPKFLDANPVEAAALLWLELHKEVVA